jgi:hypothetical protein
MVQHLAYGPTNARRRRFELRYVDLCDDGQLQIENLTERLTWVSGSGSVDAFTLTVAVPR